MGGIVPGVNNLLDPALLAELDRIAKTLPLNASPQQIGQAFVEGLKSQPGATPGVTPTASGLGNWGAGALKGSPTPPGPPAPAPGPSVPVGGRVHPPPTPVDPEALAAASKARDAELAAAQAAKGGQAAGTASEAGAAATKTGNFLTRTRNLPGPGIGGVARKVAEKTPSWVKTTGMGLGKIPGVGATARGAARVLASPAASTLGKAAGVAGAAYSIGSNVNEIRNAAQGNLGRELDWSEKIAQRLGLDVAVNKLFGVENTADEQMRQQNQQALLRRQLSEMGYPAVKEPTMGAPAPGQQPAAKPPASTAPAPAPAADQKPTEYVAGGAWDKPQFTVPEAPDLSKMAGPAPDTTPPPQIQAKKGGGWGEALQALGRMNPFTALAPSGMDASFYQTVMKENMLQQERFDQSEREKMRIEENEKNRQAELQAMDARFREGWERWKADKEFQEAENAKNREHQRQIYEDRDKTYPASPEVAAKLGVPVGTPVPISALTGVAQITASEGYRSEQRSLTERGQNIDSAQGLRQEAARLRAGLQGAEGLLLQKQNPQAYQDMLARIAQYEQRADALDVQVPGAVQPGAAPGPSAAQTTAPPPPQPAQPQGGMFSGGLSALGGALAGPNNYPGAVQPQKPTAAQVEATMPQEIRSGITKLGSAEQNAIALAYQEANGNMADLAQSLFKITQKYPGTANLLNPEINRIRR